MGIGRVWHPNWHRIELSARLVRRSTVQVFLFTHSAAFMNFINQHKLLWVYYYYSNALGALAAHTVHNAHHMKQNDITMAMFMLDTCDHADTPAHHSTT